MKMNVDVDLLAICQEIIRDEKEPVIPSDGLLNAAANSGQALSSLANAMQKLGIAVNPDGKSPADWTWHHVINRPGVLQLVPHGQHRSGSAWQNLLHYLPGGGGGYSQWGRAW